MMTTEQEAALIDEEAAKEIDALLAKLTPDNPAVRAIRFIERLKGWHGEIAGQPIRLLPFQKRFIIDLLGTFNAQGLRQYREALLMIPKGNAKSSLCSLLAMYFFFCSKDAKGKPRQTSIAISALTYGQAEALFNGVWETIKQDDYLLSCTQKYRMKLVHKKTGSVIKVYSQDADAAHSASPEVCLFDEIAAWKNDKLWNALTAACFNKAWKEPLVINITHAQPDLSREHFAFKKFKRAEAAKANPSSDPRFLPVLYKLDDEKDWKDEKLWKSVSPGLGPILSFDNMREQLKTAKLSASDEVVFRTYYLNQFTNSSGAGFPVKWWYQCGPHFLESFEGRTCYAALDIASKLDLSCLCLCFPSKDKDGRPVFDFLYWYWLPEARAKQSGTAGRYSEWARPDRPGGPLITLHDDDAIDQPRLIKEITDVVKPMSQGGKYKVQYLAYDEWGSAYIAQLLSGAVRCEVFGQTIKNFNLPIKELEAATIQKRVGHGDNPITNWCAENLRYKSDDVGNLMTSKKRSLGPIDGMQASIMAFGCAMKHNR